MKAVPPLSTANAFKVWCALKLTRPILTVGSFCPSLGLRTGVVSIILRAWNQVMF